jgi:NAD(P)H-hydrate epimerase
MKGLLPKRRASSHKGDFGRLLILAGSRRMTGCAVLSVQAALRSGAGLVTLGFPKSLHSLYTRRLTEAMFLPLAETARGTLSRKSLAEILKFSKTQDAAALGPGLGREKETGRLIRDLVFRIRKPLVLDADAITAFAQKADRLKKLGSPVVLTPHPGEFERLFGFAPLKDVPRRKAAALRAAGICGCVVVLKGHRTVVAAPDGKWFVNPTGNPGLAKGGTGDVLFGVIASFLAQGLGAFDASRLGVFVHGLAADLAVRRIAKASLLASDLMDCLSPAIKKFE